MLCVVCLVASVMFGSLQPYRLQPARLPLSMGFSRQEHWSCLPCPPPGDLPNPGIKPSYSILAGRFFTTSASWEAPCSSYRFGKLILSHFLWELSFYASVSCPRTTISKQTGLMMRSCLSEFRLTGVVPFTLIGSLPGNKSSAQGSPTYQSTNITLGCPQYTGRPSAKANNEVLKQTSGHMLTLD